MVDFDEQWKKVMGSEYFDENSEYRCGNATLKIKKPDFKGKIDIDISDNNDYIVVCIKDNGSGIRDINKAMNPYFTTKKNGTGLGLPIVDKIINEHKGDFSIKNMSNNDGTEINISFPKI